LQAKDNSLPLGCNSTSGSTRVVSGLPANIGHWGGSD